MLEDILRSAGVKYTIKGSDHALIGKNRDIEVYIEDINNILVLSTKSLLGEFRHICILDLIKYGGRRSTSKRLIEDLNRLISYAENMNSGNEENNAKTIIDTLEEIDIKRPTLVSSIDYNTNELLHRFISIIELGIREDGYVEHILHVNLTRRIIKICDIYRTVESCECSLETIYSVFQPYNILYEKEFSDLHDELVRLRDILVGWIVPSNKVLHLKVEGITRTNYPCIKILYKSNKVETPFIDLKLMVGCVGKDIEGASYRCIYKVIGGSKTEFPYIMSSNSKVRDINDFQLIGKDVCEEGIIKFINDVEYEGRLDKFNESLDKITNEIKSIYSYEARQCIGVVSYPLIVKYFEVDLTNNVVKAVIEYYINIGYPSNIDFRIRYTITDDLSISCSILDEFGRDQGGLENMNIIEICRLYLTTQCNRLSDKYIERLGN